MGGQGRLQARINARTNIQISSPCIPNIYHISNSFFFRIPQKIWQNIENFIMAKFIIDPYLYYFLSSFTLLITYEHKQWIKWTDVCFGSPGQIFNTKQRHTIRIFLLFIKKIKHIFFFQFDLSVFFVFLSLASLLFSLSPSLSLFLSLPPSLFIFF